MIERPIHLATGADERFAPGLLVSVCSALTGLPRSTRAVIHVLDGGLSQSTRASLENACGRLGGEVVFHRIDTGTFATFQAGAHGSRMYYARLHLASVVPADRLVYFDSDMVVLGDLSQLLARDMQNLIALACPDRKVHTLSDDCPWPLDERERSAPYFNSGFLVLDLAAWRSADIGGTALSLAAKTRDGYRWHDQSVLNYALRGRVGMLPASWNWQQEMVPDDLAVSELVLHFTTPKKPWTFFGAGLRHRLWREFYSAFGGSPTALFLRRREVAGLGSGLAENALRRSPLLRSLYLRALANDTGTISYYTSGPGGSIGTSELAASHPLVAEVRRRIAARLT